MAVEHDCQVDEEALRHCLERRLAELYDRPAAIVGIRRTPSDHSTSYACEIVTLELATGDEVRIFLKDFGYSRLPKDGLMQRREREVGVYRDLLAKADLGTATYFGAIWNEPRQRFWLLLEFVDGKPLRGCGFEQWVRAAGWLGRLHGYFAHRATDVSACGFLVGHDARFFRSRAEGALGAVSQISIALAARLARLLEGYDRLADIMASHQSTLVHSSFRSQNILVATDAEPVRICPTDWELAAFGAPFYDLAYLSDGFGPPRLAILWDAYRQHARQYGLAVPDDEEMGYLVDCFRFHKILKSLSESVSRQFPTSIVAKLVGQGEALRPRLGL